MSYTVTQTPAARSSDEGALKAKVNDRSEVCRSAPVEAAECRMSVPLDRRDLTRWSLDFVRTGEDHDAALTIHDRYPLGLDPQRPGVDCLFLQYVCLVYELMHVQQSVQPKA
jgi:hypothetical protein